MRSFTGRRAAARQIPGHPATRWFSSSTPVLVPTPQPLGRVPGQSSALPSTRPGRLLHHHRIVIDSLERLRNVMLVAIGAVALASLYVLREWWGGSSVYGSGYRPGYVTGDPNFFSASALLCLPLAFAWTIGSRPRWERLYCGVCLFIGLSGIMVSASRWAFLGLCPAWPCCSALSLRVGPGSWRRPPRLPSLSPSRPLPAVNRPSATSGPGGPVPVGAAGSHDRAHPSRVGPCNSSRS